MSTRPHPTNKPTGYDGIDIGLGGLTKVIGEVSKWLKNPPLQAINLAC
ncbi:hypothetical protein [Roseofilum sp. Guam]|nr:hypothetical protein [Roseofilum sp. Guam]MBP0029257.1 hypothetical protein [Roseofilum sp. Guam]